MANTHTRMVRPASQLEVSSPSSPTRRWSFLQPHSLAQPRKRSHSSSAGELQLQVSTNVDPSASRATDCSISGAASTEF